LAVGPTSPEEYSEIFVEIPNLVLQTTFILIRLFPVPSETFGKIFSLNKSTGASPLGSGGRRTRRECGRPSRWAIWGNNADHQAITNGYNGIRSSKTIMG
jgi:hypothetical protein